MISVQLLNEILVVLGVALPTLLSGLFARRRTTAEAETTLSAEARKWADSFAAGATTATRVAHDAVEQAKQANQRAAGAEAQFRQCDDELRELRRYTARLSETLRQHGITPPAR